MEKRFFSIKQAAEYSSLSARYLYLLCANKKLRHSKIGKKILISVKDLEEFINQNVVEAIDWDEQVHEMNG